MPLQLPMACPGLTTHTLAGLCALWLPSTACSSGNKHKPAKSEQPPQTTTCPALPQPPAQAPQHLLHTAEAAFDISQPYDMPRAGHSHASRALCAVVAECCLLFLKFPQTAGKTAIPTNLLPSSAAAPSAGTTTPAARCRGCIYPCRTPWHAQNWPITH